MKKIILSLVVVLSTTISFGQTFDEIKKKAEQGDVDAQFELALKYYNGEDTATDKKQALYWYKKSAEQGDSKAQYNLALMYDNGEGTATDKKQAFYWYKKVRNKELLKLNITLL